MTPQWVNEIQNMPIVQARPPDTLYIESVEARFGGLDLTTEAVAFRTYWTGKPRELARLRDWRIAWLNWLKKVVAGPNYRRPLSAVAAGSGHTPTRITAERLAGWTAARNRKELAQLEWLAQRARDGRATEEDHRLTARITHERSERRTGS